MNGLELSYLNMLFNKKIISMNNDVLIPIRIPTGWEVFNIRLCQIGNIDEFISENNIK